MITGKDLIAMGLKPGKFFGEVLDYANSNSLNLEETKAYAEEKQPVHLELHEEVIPYYINIKGDTPEEKENIVAVIKDMDSIMRTPTAITGSIMPDACPVGGGHIPVGGVAVAKNAIHPGWHSADICCSVMTTNLGKIDPKTVLDTAFGVTQFGPGGRKEHGGWENLLYDNKELTTRILGNYFTKDYIEKAAKHLGTQGDGNHFLFIGVSKLTGDTHIVTHHGSRGFGASVYKKGMDVAERYRRQLSPATLPQNAWIPYSEFEGQLYWEALQIIRAWTKLNHECIHDSIINKLKTSYLSRFWNEHNFVFKDKDNCFYHAKGATPLSDEFVPDNPYGLRLIPLNMSQPVLVIKGDVTLNNLGFAPHGAGRNISRGQHKRNKAGKTDGDIFREETKGLDVRFFSGVTDISELPSAYKDADTVRKQMEYFGLGEVVDEIMPYGCIMAGETVFDWKNKKKR